MTPLNPKKEGICDVCGGKLIIRPDDTKEVDELIFIINRSLKKECKNMMLKLLPSWTDLKALARLSTSKLNEEKKITQDSGNSLNPSYND